MTVTPPAGWSSFLERIDDFVDVELLAYTEPGGEQIGEIEYALSTTEDQTWFQGHFPGRPVLPGVVIVRCLILDCVRCCTPMHQLARLSGVKFLLPVLPKERLRVRISLLAAEGRASFVVFKDSASSPSVESTSQNLQPRIEVGSPSSPDVVSRGGLHFSQEAD